MSLGALMVAGAIAGVLTVRDEGVPARGDLIAYSCKEPGNRWYAICLMNADGSEQRRLTSRLETTDSAWSPDGGRIAFTRNEDVGESTTFTDDDVFVMDADGDDVLQLTQEADGRMAGQPSWSPDGEHIVFMRGQSVHSVVPSRFGALFVMRADGSKVRRLTSGPDTAPAWSPDGREIAFTRGENLSSFTRANEDVYVVDAGGGDPRRLTHSGALLRDDARVVPGRLADRVCAHDVPNAVRREGGHLRHESRRQRREAPARAPALRRRSAGPGVEP